jgi:hypothetical protein
MFALRRSFMKWLNRKLDRVISHGDEYGTPWTVRDKIFEDFFYGVGYLGLLAAVVLFSWGTIDSARTKETPITRTIDNKRIVLNERLTPKGFLALSKEKDKSTNIRVYLPNGNSNVYYDYNGDDRLDCLVEANSKGSTINNYGSGISNNGFTGYSGITRERLEAGQKEFESYLKILTDQE